MMISCYNCVDRVVDTCIMSYISLFESEKRN
jgi:hypothetical protein